MIDGSDTFRGTRFNHAELARIARAKFGLTGRLSIKRRPMRKAWGWAQCWPWRQHVIQIDSGHPTVEDALRTLAHELTHCAQAERDYVGFRKDVEAGLALLSQKRYSAYDRTPLEAEAIAAEERWRELLPGVTR